MHIKKNKKGTPEILNLTCSSCGFRFSKKRESFLGVTMKGPCPKCGSQVGLTKKRREGLDIRLRVD